MSAENVDVDGNVSWEAPWFTLVLSSGCSTFFGFDAFIVSGSYDLPPLIHVRGSLDVPPLV